MTLLSVVQFMAAIILLPIFGKLTENLGKRVSIIIGCAAVIVLSILTIFTNALWQIFIIKALSLNLSLGLYNASAAFFAEVMGSPSKKKFYVLINYTSIGLASVLCGLVSEIVVNWKQIIYFQIGLHGLCLLLTLFSVESPDFYVQRGKLDVALKKFEKISQMNNLLSHRKNIVDFKLKEQASPTIAKVGVFDIWTQNFAFSLQTIALATIYTIFYLVYWGFTLNLAILPVQ